MVFITDLELTAYISSYDLKRLKKLARNSYKITVLGEGGYRYRLKSLWKRKVTIVGILIFAAFLYYQTLFITEIQINGYETISEPQLRQTLAQAGLYEGCRKNIDINKVKITIYEAYDEISWIGIRFNGNLAQVSVAEGARPVKTKLEKKKPCSIVADKAGYISRIIPVEGIRAVEDGAFVKKGDVLINGVVPLRNVAYGTDSENETETYVHAEGTVEAKIPVHLSFYAERYERVKKETGKKLWSISINNHDPAEFWNSFEACKVKRKKLINMVRPFPLKIDAVCIEEVTLAQKEVSEEQLKKAVNVVVRQYVKENLHKNTQIINKSLNFSREKNIITIGVTLETLQQIGIEEEIIVDKPDGKSKKSIDR